MTSIHLTLTTRLLIITLATLGVFAAAEADEFSTLHSGTAGMFDPSIAIQPTDTQTPANRWMVYSVVTAVTNQHRTVHLALARQHASGWKTAVEVLVPAIPDTATKGVWQAEVGSIAYNPHAEEDKRWQVVYHRYLNVNGERRFNQGWIALRRAASPQGLAQAPEEPLFTAKAYEVTKSPPQGVPTITAQQAKQLSLGRLHADLKGCLVATEPGFATADRMYLSLMCAEKRLFRPIDNRIFLLSCSGACDHQDYRYEGTLLTGEIAKAHGTHNFSAPTIRFSPGQMHLMVSPVSNKPWNDAYNGCWEFIVRQGLPLLGPVRVTAQDRSRFHGACEYNGDRWLIGQVQITPSGPHFRFHSRHPPTPAEQ